MTYLGRGWLRSSGFGWYASTFVRSQVQREHHKQFTGVNQELAQFGINKWGEPAKFCNHPLYQGLGVSSSCYVEVQSGSLTDFYLFLTKWHKQSDVFSKYMNENGWTNYVSNTQDINKIFDTDPGLSTNDTGYEKTVNGIICSIRIGYNPQDVDGRKVFVTETCSKTAEIFGGY